MKAYVGRIVLVLPLLLCSCVHKTQQAQVQPPLAPPIEDTPLPKPDNAPANLPPPVISLPDNSKDHPVQPAPPPETQPPAPKHKKPAGKPATPAPTEGSAPAAQATEQASNTAPAAGNLSLGDPANQIDATQTMITETERGLSAITRKLNDQEAKTSAQIKEFLKQARETLAAKDVAGANVLATKAKVLLNELTQ
jgi:hypothetical protein